ncbi:MAG: hypothetical protein LBI87_15570 [Candidatus Accumulibacter sp.]|jgi:hypothetical protein|nr:hypothetical protein [Accumulibacter sp.]
MISMSARRLLYLGSHQMTAYLWRRGALIREATFSPAEEDLRRFALYLEENSKSLFSLLVNVPDEGFHIETIPYLRGADRQTVIRRKLAQTFFNTPLCAAISLGHEKTHRRNERLLLAALNNWITFQPWLDGIRAADVALSGVFSLPLLAPTLLRKLRVPPEPCLLLSVQDQSIRQSFFEKGALHFSRLTPLQHSGIAGIAQAFATESAKLQPYLSSQRLIGRGQVITAHILAHPGAFRAIRNSCVDTPSVRFNILDLVECARRVGLKTEPPDTHAETLFLHLLAADRPGVQFAGEELRHDFRIAQTRSLLRGAGVALMTGCLLLSGQYLFDARRIARDAEALRAEAAAARQRYENIVGTFPSVPVDNETLKNAIGRYLVEESRSTTPIPLYQEVSRALQAAPDIEIEALDWRIGDAEAAGPNAMTRPLPEDGEGLAVRGTLRPDATTREALAAFGRFVAALRANTGLTVDVLRQPFGIASDTALRGGGSREDEEKTRDFELFVTRKIEPPFDERNQSVTIHPFREPAGPP